MSDSENEEPTVPIRSVRIVEPKPKQSGFFSWFGVNNDEDDESEAEADDVQSDGESISIMPSSVTAGDLTSIRPPPTQTNSLATEVSSVPSENIQSFDPPSGPPPSVLRNRLPSLPNPPPIEDPWAEIRRLEGLLKFERRAQVDLRHENERLDAELKTIVESTVRTQNGIDPTEKFKLTKALVHSQAAQQQMKDQMERLQSQLYSMRSAQSSARAVSPISSSSSIHQSKTPSNLFKRPDNVSSLDLTLLDESGMKGEIQKLKLAVEERDEKLIEMENLVGDAVVQLQAMEAERDSLIEKMADLVPGEGTYERNPDVLKSSENTSSPTKTDENEFERLKFELEEMKQNEHGFLNKIEELERNNYEMEISMNETIIRLETEVKAAQHDNEDYTIEIDKLKNELEVLQNNNAAEEQEDKKVDVEQQLENLRMSLESSLNEEKKSLFHEIEILKNTIMEKDILLESISNELNLSKSQIHVLSKEKSDLLLSLNETLIKVEATDNQLIQVTSTVEEFKDKLESAQNSIRDLKAQEQEQKNVLYSNIVQENINHPQFIGDNSANVESFEKLTSQFDELRIRYEKLLIERDEAISRAEGVESRLQSIVLTSAMHYPSKHSQDNDDDDGIIEQGRSSFDADNHDMLLSEIEERENKLMTLKNEVEQKEMELKKQEEKLQVGQSQLLQDRSLLSTEKESLKHDKNLIDLQKIDFERLRDELNFEKEILFEKQKDIDAKHDANLNTLKQKENEIDIKLEHINTIEVELSQKEDKLKLLENTLLKKENDLNKLELETTMNINDLHAEQPIKSSLQPNSIPIVLIEPGLIENPLSPSSNQDKTDQNPTLLNIEEILKLRNELVQTDIELRTFKSQYEAQKAAALSADKELLMVKSQLRQNKLDYEKNEEELRLKMISRDSDWKIECSKLEKKISVYIEQTKELNMQISLLESSLINSESEIKMMKDLVDEKKHINPVAFQEAIDKAVIRGNEATELYESIKLKYEGLITEHNSLSNDYESSKVKIEELVAFKNDKEALARNLTFQNNELTRKLQNSVTEVEVEEIVMASVLPLKVELKNAETKLEESERLLLLEIKSSADITANLHKFRIKIQELEDLVEECNTEKESAQYQLESCLELRNVDQEKLQQLKLSLTKQQMLLKTLIVANHNLKLRDQFSEDFNMKDTVGFSTVNSPSHKKKLLKQTSPNSEEVSHDSILRERLELISIQEKTLKKREDSVEEMELQLKIQSESLRSQHGTISILASKLQNQKHEIIEKFNTIRSINSELKVELSDLKRQLKSSNDDLVREKNRADSIAKLARYLSSNLKNLRADKKRDKRNTSTSPIIFNKILPSSSTTDLNALISHKSTLESRLEPHWADNTPLQDVFPAVQPKPSATVEFESDMDVNKRNENEPIKVSRVDIGALFSKSTLYKQTISSLNKAIIHSESNQFESKRPPFSVLSDPVKLQHLLLSEQNRRRSKLQQYEIKDSNIFSNELLSSAIHIHHGLNPKKIFKAATTSIKKPPFNHFSSPPKNDSAGQLPSFEQKARMEIKSHTQSWNRSKSSPLIKGDQQVKITSMIKSSAIKSDESQRKLVEWDSSVDIKYDEDLQTNEISNSFNIPNPKSNPENLTEANKNILSTFTEIAENISTKPPFDKTPLLTFAEKIGIAMAQDGSDNVDSTADIKYFNMSSPTNKSPHANRGLSASSLLKLKKQVDSLAKRKTRTESKSVVNFDNQNINQDDQKEKHNSLSPSPAHDRFDTIERQDTKASALSLKFLLASEEIDSKLDNDSKVEVDQSLQDDNNNLIEINNNYLINEVKQSADTFNSGLFKASIVNSSAYHNINESYALEDEISESHDKPDNIYIQSKEEVRFQPEVALISSKSSESDAIVADVSSKFASSDNLFDQGLFSPSIATIGAAVSLKIDDNGIYDSDDDDDVITDMPDNVIQIPEKVNVDNVIPPPIEISEHIAETNVATVHIASGDKGRFSLFSHKSIAELGIYDSDIDGDDDDNKLDHINDGLDLGLSPAAQIPISHMNISDAEIVDKPSNHSSVSNSNNNYVYEVIPLPPSIMDEQSSDNPDSVLQSPSVPLSISEKVGIDNNILTQNIDLPSENVSKDNVQGLNSSSQEDKNINEDEEQLLPNGVKRSSFLMSFMSAARNSFAFETENQSTPDSSSSSLSNNNLKTFASSAHLDIPTSSVHTISAAISVDIDPKDTYNNVDVDVNPSHISSPSSSNPAVISVSPLNKTADDLNHTEIVLKVSVATDDNAESSSSISLTEPPTYDEATPLINTINKLETSILNDITSSSSELSHKSNNHIEMGLTTHQNTPGFVEADLQNETLNIHPRRSEFALLFNSHTDDNLDGNEEKLTNEDVILGLDIHQSLNESVSKTGPALQDQNTVNSTSSSVHNALDSMFFAPSIEGATQKNESSSFKDLNIVADLNTNSQSSSTMKFTSKRRLRRAFDVEMSARESIVNNDQSNLVPLSKLNPLDVTNSAKNDFSNVLKMSSSSFTNNKIDIKDGDDKNANKSDFLDNFLESRRSSVRSNTSLKISLLNSKENLINSEINMDSYHQNAPLKNDHSHSINDDHSSEDIHEFNTLFRPSIAVASSHFEVGSDDSAYGLIQSSKFDNLNEISINPLVDSEHHQFSFNQTENDTSSIFEADKPTIGISRGWSILRQRLMQHTLAEDLRFAMGDGPLEWNMKNKNSFQTVIITAVAVARVFEKLKSILVLNPNDANTNSKINQLMSDLQDSITNGTGMQETIDKFRDRLDEFGVLAVENGDEFSNAGRHSSILSGAVTNLFKKRKSMIEISSNNASDAPSLGESDEFADDVEWNEEEVEDEQAFGVRAKEDDGDFIADIGNYNIGSKQNLKDNDVFVNEIPEVDYSRVSFRKMKIGGYENDGHKSSLSKLIKQKKNSKSSVNFEYEDEFSFPDFNSEEDLYYSPEKKKKSKKSIYDDDDIL